MRQRFKAQLAAPASKSKVLLPSAVVTIKAAAIAEGQTESVGPKRFEGIAYAGERVPGGTGSPKIALDYVVNLAGLTAAKSVKADLDHKPDQRVGHITDYENDGKQVRVVGLLSAATPYRDQVVNSAGDGYAWEISIQANLSKPRLVAAGKTAVVNGRTETGPLVIFDKGVLTDIGFVSHGASEGNEVRIAASAVGAEQMNPFETFVASLGLDIATISDTQRVNLQALFDGQNPAQKSKTLAEIADVERRENERVDKIQTICLAAMKEMPRSIDQIKSLGENAIANSTSANEFETLLVRSTRGKAGQILAQMQGTSNDKNVMEAALAMASFLPDLEKHYSAETLQHVNDCGMNRGFSIQQMLMQAAHQNGYSCRAGERVHAGNLADILEYALPPRGIRVHLSSGLSTASLPTILGNVANKHILAGYMEEDPTWREFAEIKPTNNFYQQTHMRMLDNLEYEEVGSGGEIHHGTLGEETYTTQLKTFGKMLGLSRQQIINDDAGAFADLRPRLGRGAAKKFLTVFWTAFLNNSAFFTAALTNYITGSTTNLGTDGVGLGLMVAAFRQMTSPTADGLKRVGQDLNPTKILVPPELEANAGINYRNQNLGSVANSSANIYQNRFRPVVQWRLSNSSFTGYSTTAYYLFGDDVKPMCVTFLNGQQAPTVQSTEADFDILGILFRGFHDFSCDKSEYLAGVKSKGAS